jgi:hypothetical protein
MARGDAVLRLRFQASQDEDPRPEQVASVLSDLEGLYRVAPAAVALGVPVAELLASYYAATAEMVILDLTEPSAEVFEYRFMREFERFARRSQSQRYPLPALEELFYVWMQEGGPARRTASISPPPNALRCRQLSMGSPLDVLANIPPEYWMGSGGGLMLFLAALERRFNMVERIRTERIDLRAKRAERRADELEAELRRERAARELAGLRESSAGFQLVAGALEPDEDPEDGGEPSQHEV